MNQDRLVSKYERPHILLIYREMIPSVRLCPHGQFEQLAMEGIVEYRAVQEMKLKPQDLTWADTVIQVRADNEYEAQMTKKLLSMKKYLVYAMDDDLFHVPAMFQELHTFYADAAVRKRMQYMMHASHAFFSTSPFLLERYASNHQLQVLIRGFTTEVAPFVEHAGERPIRIAFASSAGRWKDLETCMGDALKKLKAVCGKRIQYVFMGTRPALAETLDAIVLPYFDSYPTYRKQLDALEIDIGLAPIPDSNFHQCKYINKFIEYGATGALGVFSAVEPYTSLQRQGAPGLFCLNTAEAWFSALQSLVNDRPRLERLRRAAHDLVSCQYSREEAAAALRVQIGDVLNYRAPPEKYSAFALNLQKIQNFARRLLDALKKYKWKFGTVAAQKAGYKIKNLWNETNVKEQ